MSDDILHIDTGAYALLGDKEQKLRESLEAGFTRRDACYRSGIWYAEFRKWMERGGQGHPKSYSNCPPDIHWEPYHGFATRVIESERIGQANKQPARATQFPAMPTIEQQKAILWSFSKGRAISTVARYSGVTATRLTSVLRHGGYPHPFHYKHPLNTLDIIEPYISFVKEIQRAEDAFFTGDGDYRPRPIGADEPAAD